MADLGSAGAGYELLGLTREGADEAVPSQGVDVRVYTDGRTLVELLAPTDTEGPVARFLRKRGPGLHHLAYRVPDIDAKLAEIAAGGAPLLDERARPGRTGTRVAFLHPKFGGGVLIELVEYPQD